MGGGIGQSDNTPSKLKASSISAGTLERPSGCETIIGVTKFVEALLGK